MLPVTVWSTGVISYQSDTRLVINQLFITATRAVNFTLIDEPSFPSSATKPDRWQNHWCEGQTRPDGVRWTANIWSLAGGRGRRGQ